jgi:Leucine-rich repeat (LRR) protein
MLQAQSWLNENYPKSIRKLIKNLCLRGKKIEGALDLREFTNLEKLDCAYNQITGLDLTGLDQLKVLYADNNCLTNLDYSSFDSSKLTGLIIDNNNLTEQNIEVFSKFINLEDLRLGSTDPDKRNHFIGSLESLKDLTRLEDLDISNTGINEGVKFLPDNIKRISYSVTKSKSKLKKIVKEIDNFLNNKKNQNWQNIHSEFTEREEREWKGRYFSYPEVQEWIKAGLQPSEWNLAAYLRAEGKQPSSELDLKFLKKENRGAQDWLDKKYPLEVRKWENWLDIGRSGLIGSLVLENWINLERLDCYHNQLTSLTLKNCPNLNRVECSDNELANLIIDKDGQISVLNASNNRLTSLNFLTHLNPEKLTFLYLTNNHFLKQDIKSLSPFAKLKTLYLANNDFSGNLKSLTQLKNLERLGISGTKITHSLEYSPENLKEISLPISPRYLEENVDSFKTLRLTSLAKGQEYSNVPAYDYQLWRESNKELIQIILACDKLADIQTNNNDFFNSKKDFISQHRQLFNTQKNIKWVNYSQYSFTILAASGSVLGGYYSVPGGYLGGIAGMLGVVISHIINERLKTKEQVIKQRRGINFDKQNETIDKFIQSTVQLENDYQELTNILGAFSIFPQEPTKSATLNRAFINFLETAVQLKEDLQVIMTNNRDLEKGWREEMAIKFAQSLQNNLPILNQTITNLITEVNSYRNKMYENELNQQSSPSNNQVIYELQQLQTKIVQI